MIQSHLYCAAYHSGYSNEIGGPEGLWTGQLGGYGSASPAGGDKDGQDWKDVGSTGQDDGLDVKGKKRLNCLWNKTIVGLVWAEDSIESHVISRGDSAGFWGRYSGGTFFYNF